MKTISDIREAVRKVRYLNEKEVQGLLQTISCCLDNEHGFRKEEDKDRIVQNIDYTLALLEDIIDSEDEEEDDGNRYCTDCGGSGEGQHDGTTCHTCKGQGEYFEQDRDYYEADY